MYCQGIGRVFWGYLNFWDSWAFDRPDFNASRNISISGMISSMILCKKVRPVRFGALAEFPRGTSVLSGNWPCILGVFQFLGFLGL